MLFNEKQQEIVNHTHGPLLCIAGPGSGKTTSIIGKVLNMVKEGVDPTKILVMTFTKAAADDMKSKYLATENAVSGPSFGTIHSICFRILRQFDASKYTRESVLSEIDQKMFLRNEIKSLRIERIDQDAIINGILAGISHVKNNKANPAFVKVDGLQDGQFKEIFEKYENYKKLENKIDYDDMVFITDKVLSENPSVLAMWRKVYTHYIVDEFQDTNILQSQIIYNLAYPLNNICVVGDDDQCQPASTKILMSDNEEKNIEDIVVGDKLMNSNNPNIKTNVENVVVDISKSYYVGNMFRIETENRASSTYTANHRTFVKLHFNENKFALCVRKANDGNLCFANIPFTAKELNKLKNNNKMFWVLKVCFDKQEADNELKELVLLASKLKDVERILEVYAKDYDYPFYAQTSWQKDMDFEKHEFIEIYAQNLMRWCMSCVRNLEMEFNLSKEKEDKISAVYIQKIKDPIFVYSLKTSTGVYVADDIITHNCIYRFRGAVPQIMLDFEKQFPGCKTVILNVNYRSEPVIVETSKRLIENNKTRFEKPLAAHKTGKGNVTYTTYKNRDKEIASIVKEIKYKQRKNEPLDDIAVLYRTNNQAAQITQAFIKADIPFYTNELVINIYDHWIFNDFKNFKKVVDNECNINEFLSVINRPNKYVSRKMLPSTYSEEEIMKSVFKIPESWKREKMRETLDDWFFWIDKMSEMTPYQFISTIRKQLEYDKYVETYAESNHFDKSQFVDVMNEIQDAAEAFETFDEWYAYIEQELKDFREKMKEKKKENSVTLSTMHKAKGLEWKEVYIVDCNEDITPYIKAESTEDLEEERRMFYVAATRAKETLHICSIEKRNKSPMYLSRFVKEMQPIEKEYEVEQDFKTPVSATQFQNGMWVFHKTFGSGIVTRVDSGKIHISFSSAGAKVLDEKWCETNLQLF